MEPSKLQAALFDFAIAELVRGHRDSFQPLWTTDSWAKLMIWLALNCGCQGDEAGLRAFAEALGPALSARLRRLFFEREQEDPDLRLLADPAEDQVLVLPAVPGAALPDPEQVAISLERAGLADLVAPPERWQRLEGLLAIPWQRPG
jgi:hypothetical protein